VLSGLCRKFIGNTLLPTICGIFHVPSFQYVVWFINFATEPLDLMLTGRLSPEQAFGSAGAPTSAGLPQAIKDANIATRGLEENRYRQTFLRSTQSPLAGTEPVTTEEPERGRMPRTDIGGLKGRALQAQYQTREAALVREWLQLQAEGLVFNNLAQARPGLTALVMARMREFFRLESQIAK
jgi:hypothetical protein